MRGSCFDVLGVLQSIPVPPVERLGIRRILPPKGIGKTRTEGIHIVYSFYLKVETWLLENFLVLVEAVTGARLQDEAGALQSIEQRVWRSKMSETAGGQLRYCVLLRYMLG